MAVSEAQIRARLEPRIRKDLLRRGIRVQNEAKRLLSGARSHVKRVDTGNLRSSIRTQESSYFGNPAVRVGTNVKYSLYVHQGTGLFGPRRQLIRPRRAKVLVFKPRGANRTVFARYIRGMRANHYLTDALPVARG